MDHASYIEHHDTFDASEVVTALVPEGVGIDIGIGIGVGVTTMGVLVVYDL